MIREKMLKPRLIGLVLILLSAPCLASFQEDFYFSLPLGPRHKKAIQKMQNSPAFRVVREHLSKLHAESATRVILLEAGFYSWGGYEGTLWIGQPSGCFLVVGVDYDPKDQALLETRQLAVNCRDFDSIWTSLMEARVWDLKSHLESTQPSLSEAPPNYTARSIVDGGTYFLSVHEANRHHVIGVYEPCRLQDVEGTADACAAMRLVSEAAQERTHLTLGPPQLAGDDTSRSKK